MKQNLVSGRLQSLDALRGFDMFWIISGEGLIHGTAMATGWSFMEMMSAQLHHSPWNGFTFYDLIFPLFIFVAGVSMPYSFGKKLERPGVDRKAEKNKIYKSLVNRTLILIVLGMIVNKSQTLTGYDQFRFASVLGRIALSCLLGAIIFLNCSLKNQIRWFAGILLGYWAMMMLVPVPGIGAGILTPEGNLAGYLDRRFLPGEVLRKVYDPEGILSTIPAIGSALLGIFTGQFLRNYFREMQKAKKGLILLLTGILSLGAGLLWNTVFPINKNMWTSSFVIFAGGWSFLLLGIFYLVIDVWNLRRWSMPLVWIGTNSILIYMLSHGVVDFKYTSDFLFGGVINLTPERWHYFWLFAGIFLVQMIFMRFLYRKRLFWKI